MEWKEKRLITKVAQMYYDENKTQQEIADKYGISRSSISRLLQRARQNGIVEIKIHIESSYTMLEKELEKKFNLKEVIITPTDKKDEGLKQLLAEAAAGYLLRVLKDGDVVGVSWGTTLAYVSEYIKDEKRDVVFVPLVGGVGQSRPDAHSNQIVLNLARAFNGKWQLLHVPAIVDSKKVKASLLSDSNISNCLGTASSSSIALIGIGAPLAPNSTILETGYYNDRVLSELESAGAVSDLCSIFIDTRGRVCDVELNQRSICIPIDNLKQIPNIVAVAGGADKHRAVLAALRGNYCHVLVTDEETGEFLLNVF